jgi:hypothetical protein
MSAAVVNSEHALQSILGDIRELWREHHYLRITIKTGKDRSLDQNAISHAWYEQVARELREDTAAKVKRFCKLHFGIPILRTADDEFRAFYDLAIKPLDYERKLEAMDHLPVTSEMTVKQLSEYLVDMQAHYYDKHSVELKFPESAA